jgi:predicted RNase H-like nuclease (RuvC/YqgF family)
MTQQIYQFRNEKYRLMKELDEIKDEEEELKSRVEQFNYDTNYKFANKNRYHKRKEENEIENRKGMKL